MFSKPNIYNILYIHTNLILKLVFTMNKKYNGIYKYLRNSVFCVCYLVDTLANWDLITN